MNESEPEPSRLQKWLTLKVWLEHQLRLADNAIAEERARLTTEQPVGWHIEHLPGGDGTRGRGMLHVDGCGFSGRADLELDRRQAVAALDDDVIETCGGCKPEEGLRG